MATQKHLHTWIKYKGRRGMYKCDHPHCTATAEYNLVTGKASACFYCGEEFILTPQNLRLAKPHCGLCGKGSKKHPNQNTRLQDKLYSLSSLLKQELDLPEDKG